MPFPVACLDKQERILVAWPALAGTHIDSPTRNDATTTKPAVRPSSLVPGSQIPCKMWGKRWMVGVAFVMLRCCVYAPTQPLSQTKERKKPLESWRLTVLTLVTLGSALEKKKKADTFSLPRCASCAVNAPLLFDKPLGSLCKKAEARGSGWLGCNVNHADPLIR